MRDQADLEKALETLSKTLPRQASPGAEQQALARFRALRKSRSRSGMWTYGMGAAACLFLSFILSFGWHVSHRRPESVAQPRSDSSLAAAGFVLLPYGQNDVPLEQPVIVRVKIQSATGTVDADLLVGQDGMARAFRLVE